MESSDPFPDGDNPPDVPLEEIIFSCEVCQATVSEIYATKESHEGFHSGSSEDGGNGIVTKLWIGECSHVFCGKHLEGGGVAFHPKGAVPSAGCPVCPKDLPSSRQQELFAIWGLNPGEYDDIIPDSWLRCPPNRLETQDVEMDGLRFQYQHLARYSQKVNKSWKVAESKRRILESTLSGERKQWRKREAEIKKALVERDTLIQDLDAKLKKWDGRKDVINHYMGIVGPMAKDIAEMRKLLVQHGYQVPQRDYSYQPKPRPKPVAAEARHDSSATLVGSNVRTSSASRKRKADNDAYADSPEQGLDRQHPPLNTNRTMMMPPPLPKPRPPRQPDPPPTQSMPWREPQQVNHSDHHDTYSRQHSANTRIQEPRLSQQQPFEDSQQTLPQRYEHSSRSSRQPIPLPHQMPSYARGGDSVPSQASLQLYGSRGWRDEPPPSAAPSIRSGFPNLDQTPQIQPASVQQRLPLRGIQQLTSSERSGRPADKNQPPTGGYPVRPAYHHSDQAPSSVQPAYYEPGGWHNEALRAPTGGDYEPRSSQIHSSQAQQVGRTRLDPPLYQQSQRSYAGRNGTTTLSSEFHAQDGSTTAQRNTGLLSQPAKRRTSQQKPFSTAGSNAYLGSQHAPSEASYYDPVYGTLEQQSGEDAPREMESLQIPPPTMPSTARAPLNDGVQYRLTTPAHHKHLEPPAASSVVSPFFGQPSRRHPEPIQRENRQQFSYAPPASSTRGSVVNRFQRNDGMLPPTSTYTGGGRSMPSRDTSYVRPESALLDSNRNQTSMPAYIGGTQQIPLAPSARQSRPQPAAPRERVSLPSVASSSHRNTRGEGGAARGNAHDPQSIFSAAGPTRRSVRR